MSCRAWATGREGSNLCAVLGHTNKVSGYVRNTRNADDGRAGRVREGRQRASRGLSMSCKEARGYQAGRPKRCIHWRVCGERGTRLVEGQGFLRPRSLRAFHTLSLIHPGPPEQSITYTPYLYPDLNKPSGYTRARVPFHV